MGSDDGKSIMDAASPSATKPADENYSHEGRTSPAARSAEAKLPSAPLPKPPPGPAGDSVDGELPDGTRVVSTSTTVNGQTTVTAQLLDKAGQLLLSAGAGQTMERDPDTGIVQVRTGTSDHVQQFDPATGEISEALRTGSDAADVYQNLLEAFGNPQVSNNEGVQLVDASGGLPDTPATTNTNTNTFNNFLDNQGNALTTAQQTALAAHVNSLGLGGVGGLSFYSLPNGGALIANAGGDIVGEVNLNSATGGVNLKATGIAADGSTVHVSQHISESGQSLSDAQYSQQQISQLSAGLGLVNNFQSLQNWADLNDLSRLSTLVSTYNNLSQLSNGTSAFMGNLGPLTGGLGLIVALDSGDGLGIVSSVNVLSDQAIDGAINSALGSSGIPYVAIVTSLANFEDNPAQSIGSLVGMYFGGPIGGAIGGLIGGMLGGMFGDDDIPMREGLAHAQWDESGHITIVTTQDAEGGGATAHSWMSSLVSGLQAHLDQAVDANALPQYGLVPGLLPSVGFKYDPDGFNLANGAKGFMYLEWKDEAGQSQTRYYDGAGNRGDGSGETLAGDFMAHAQGAIAPAWQVQTALAHYQQSGQIDLPAQNQSLPTELTDGLHQTLQVVTLELGSGLPTEAAHNSNWIDVDADGYAEQTQWVKANQAILAVDLDGDGQIGLGETLKLQDAGQVQHARTSMGWLDADGDGKLTAQDPAFAALKLWVDVNSNGKSANGELQTLAQANITAIDFNTNPPSVERSDGSKQDLSVQTLTADTLGVAFDRTEGGLVVTNEQLDGTGSSVLHALNSREFDGQAAHTQAGSQNLDGSQCEVVQVDANRLATTTHNTIVSSSTQTSTTVGLGDTRLKSLSASTAANSVVNSNGSPANATASTRIAFVPTTQTSAQSEIRTVTDNMIENSQSLLFGGGSASLGVLAAVGAGATASAASANEMAQRPTVVSEVRNSNANGASLVATTPVSNNTFSTTASGGVDTSTSAVTFKQVDLGVLYLPPFVYNSTPITATQNTAFTTLAPTPSDPTVTTFVKATVIANAPVLVSVVNSKASATGSTTTNPASEAAPDKTTQAMSAGFAPSLGYPVVQAETLSGTEDVVLRLTQSELLYNDSTPNASADPTQPALTITEVSAPLNGQVSLVNGEVLFAPDANFHGTASFTYTVTDQYGLSTNGTAILQIAAANDAPVTQSETATTLEDTAMVFTQAELLANDTDVDVATDGQVLRISAVSGATNGAVTMLANGDIRFTPNLNYHGPAQFTYWVNDGLAANGAGAQTPATVKLTITAVNDAPVAESETIVATEDTPFFIEASALLANDSDVDTLTDGQMLSLSAVSAIAGQTHGAVSLITQLDGTQRVEFIPDLNYHGVAKFNYTVSDGHGGFITAMATVNLAAVNDAPVTQGEVATTLEDTAIVFTQAELLANDSDVDVATDGQVLRISAVSGATNGTVTMLANGDIRFVPTSNYHGPAQFTYTVSDGSVTEGAGAATNAIAKLTITAVNDVPVAVGDVFTTAEDTTTVFKPQDLLGNDTDNDVATDNDVLTITRVFAPQHCTVTLNADGTISLTPEVNYHGNVRFSYEITDTQGATSVAFVVAGVNAVNDAPVAYADTFSSLEDTIVTLNQADLLGNDSDNDMVTDGDALRVATVSNATNGEVRLLPDGQIEFVPNKNFHGTATFDYVVSDSFGATSLSTVTLQVGAVNDLPVVVNEADAATEDMVYATTANALLANDSDVDTATDGQVLFITQVQNAQHGVVAMDVNGHITFTPDANFHGTASFEYVVSDGTGAGAGGIRTGTVTLTVQAINDAPVTQGETATTPEDTPIVFTQAALLANDSDVDGATDGQVLRISAVSGATNGTVTMLANGDIGFMPNLNYHGPAQFTYTVSDGNGGTTDAIVNLTITAVNDAPVVDGETMAATEDTPFFIEASTLLANDSDVDTLTDDQVLSLSAVSEIAGQTHGMVSLITQADGTQRVQFTPDLNFHGVAKFNYTVSDGNGGFVTATATINIAAVNDAPVTQGESYSSDEDIGLIFTQAQLLANDSDSDEATDDQVLRISAVSGATNGTVTMLANGDIRFTPNSDYHGPAQFTYTVSDGNGGTTDAIVNLTITAVNDAPVVEGETMAATEDTPFFIEASTLLANDSDVDTLTDGQVLSLSAVNEIAGQTHGMVSLITQPDGTQRVQFIPDLNYHGVAKFNYTVSDGNGGFTTSIATVNLKAVNDAPVTQGESWQSNEDEALLFLATQLLSNDTDVDTATDNQKLSISRVTCDAAKGLAWVDAQGDLRFVPTSEYHGVVDLTYWVSDSAAADGAGAETPATLSLTIAPLNDIPVVQGEVTNTTEDTTLSFEVATLLINDTDVDIATDGQVLSISALGNAAHCSVSLITHTDGTQRITFVPDANFHGAASFNYTVTDSHGGTAIATAVVNLSSINDAPVTTGETAIGNEDFTLIFTSQDLLANDSDVDVATDSQVLTISRVGNATNGTVALDAQGQVHFTPDVNYCGPAQFTYWVSDGLAAHGAGAEVPATVSLTILAVNDLPVVIGETVNTNEDTMLLFNPATLLANDTDVDVVTDSQTLRIASVSNATHGTVAFVTQPDGSQQIAFTPERNHVGFASYQYTVSDGVGGTATTTVVVNLAAVNDAPDVVTDTLSATEDTSLALTQASLLANDSDVDNPHKDLLIVGVSNATHGSVSLNSDGSISYHPELDYFGAATFNYTVGDGVGGFSVGTATVSIAPVNDAPAVVGESLTLKEDEIATLSVASLLANDTDVDNTHTDLSIQSVGNATHGSVSLVTTNGTTSVVFKPELNFNGTASFTYTVSDGVGGTATTSMNLDFTPVNDVPVVNNELFVGKRNVSYSLSAAALLTNDTDVETPNGLTVASVGNAHHGSVSLINGNVVFVPEAGYSGRGSFDYVVQDANGGQSTGSTQIDFSRVNVNPTAVDDSFSGFEDVSISITPAQLLVNDSDSDNANTSLRVANLGSATHGTVGFDEQGNVVFTPDANFYGQARFTYQVSDGDGGSTWATAYVNIASVNDAPIIEDVWYGRPIYGYQGLSGVDDEGHSFMRYDRVTSAATAASVIGSGAQLYLQQIKQVEDSEGVITDYVSYHAYSPTYYRNGDMRPVAFDNKDATYSWDDGVTSGNNLVNDVSRQNGGVVAYDPDGDSHAVTFSVGITPQHGHAWVNQYTNATAPVQLDHTAASSYGIAAKGAWQYYSTRGDTYSGADAFQVSVTDSAGASTSITVNATHTGSSPAGGGNKKPVTLDLNGDGLQFIGLDDSKVYFDVNDDGWRERMAWVGAGDGLLALDTQGDHVIDKWNEISFVSYKEGAQTDLEGLQAFDSNGNGQLDRFDTRWHEFGAWVDANANGACETGEFKTLDDLGIASINLTSNHQVSTPADGVTVVGQSNFTTVDGKTHAVGDVVFAVDTMHALPAVTSAGAEHEVTTFVPETASQMTDADIQIAEVIRQALFFNQMMNTASSLNEPPLIFVFNELLTQDWVQPELHALVNANASIGVSTS